MQDRLTRDCSSPHSSRMYVNTCSQYKAGSRTSRNNARAGVLLWVSKWTRVWFRSNMLAADLRSKRIAYIHTPASGNKDRTHRRTRRPACTWRCSSTRPSTPRTRPRSGRKGPRPCMLHMCIGVRTYVCVGLRGMDRLRPGEKFSSAQWFGGGGHAPDTQDSASG